MKRRHSIRDMFTRPTSEAAPTASTLEAPAPEISPAADERAAAGEARQAPEMASQTVLENARERHDGGSTVGDWERTFVEKLSGVQTQWNRRFEDTLDGVFVPVFDEMSAFLRANGFHASTPLRQEGRRSFKFELAENAYLLLILRSTAIGEFEMRREVFVPGSEPVLSKMLGRVADVDENWTRQQFQAALDNFVESLTGQPASAGFANATSRTPELVEV